jgi:hypothetical protein
MSTTIQKGHTKQIKYKDKHQNAILIEATCEETQTTSLDPVLVKESNMKDYFTTCSSTSTPNMATSVAVEAHHLGRGKAFRDSISVGVTLQGKLAADPPTKNQRGGGPLA